MASPFQWANKHSMVGHWKFGCAQGVEKINQHGKPLSMGKQAFDG